MFRSLWPAAVALLLVVTAAPARSATDTAAAVDRIRVAAAATNSDAVLVIHDGKVLLDEASDATRAPIELMSATKSVVALGIGLLLHDGTLASLDTPVHTFYPEWAQGRKRDITVRMLLDHTSGLQNAPNAGEEIYPAPDAIQLALAAELATAPGEAFSYNNKATNLLAGIIAKASGRAMDVYLNEKLFQPLRIVPGPWFRDASDTPHAMAGLPLTAHDAAKIGQLVIDDGVAPDGQRLLPEGFVGTLFAASARSERVGLLWWRIPAWQHLTLRPEALDAARARGADAQWIRTLEQLQGQRLEGPSGMRDGFQALLGDAWVALYTREVSDQGLTRVDLFEEARGPVVAYAAEGYLGQYIVVVPDKRLVAVRQIRRRDDTPHTPAEDYAGFTSDIIALSQAL